jgi:hypothetical protein
MRHGIFIMLLATAACSEQAASSLDPGGKHDGGSTSGGGSMPDGGDMLDGSADPLCATQPVSLGVHPFAKDQPTELGRALVDTKGFAGRVYFGYGDLSANTGPIHIASLDPSNGEWNDHLTFQTERVARFRRIGDRLWAPATDPRGDMPDVEYAVAGMDHQWTAYDYDIGQSLHVFDVVERSPGELELVGSNWIDVAAGTNGGAVWRSVDGAPFAQIFPDVPNGIVDLDNFTFMEAGVFDGTIYVTSVGPPWAYDGSAWVRLYDHDFGSFQKPVSFAGKMLFEALGALWAFDGKSTRHLGITLIKAANVAPDGLSAGVYEAADGHLIVVTSDNKVFETSDLTTFRCIGDAPPGVTSVGALDGTLYFGAAEAALYRYESPSW